jgi:crotonobetainyl-CoA:carnitine CoA-transferase CaiB-like acyl-CoA transferase
MSGTMDGVRVLEVAAWTFVPAAGAVLADWGADVIKVEHPESGDPARGLTVGNVGAKDSSGVSFILEQPNRGKRSIGLDFSTERGRELLLQLAASSDVFLTSFLPGTLARLRLTVEDLREANPRIIIARGTGQGVRGDDADKGGFDSASYWTRGGIAYSLKETGAPFPPIQRPAFGDIVGGQTIAGGIAAALFKRAMTGEPSIVDVSLLGMATWQLAPDIVAAGLLGEEGVPYFSVNDMPNPVVNVYGTSDGRFVQLVMLQADRFWPEVCELIERPEFVDDPRFSTSPARFEHRVECIAELRKAFALRPLDEWRTRMAALKGVWSVVQSPGEVLRDPQVVANGYVRPVTTADGGHTYSLVANPVQFNETPPDLSRAPDHGQHTDEILAELGLDWEAVIDLKVASVVL